MAASTVKVIFLMADYGHDPTETSIPYKVFREAGFTISFATETGKAPEADELMLTGWTQKVLGAAASAIEAYKMMTQSDEWQRPLSWTSTDFCLLAYDVVFLPGGHDQGVRQVLDSSKVQQLLVEYFPHVKKPNGRKFCSAICHGVQVLAHSKDTNGRSVLRDLATTALPSTFEDTAYFSTSLILGDYYKTYGAGTTNVEDVVKACLADPDRQWRSSLNPVAPFVVEDENYKHLSGRWPGDAELLAQKTVELVRT